MLTKAIVSQTKFMIKQKEAIIVFFVLMIMCLTNYMNNVLAFRDYDVIQMYHPMKLLLLSYNRIYYNADATLLFVQLYPLLVVCPAGFVLVKEQHSHQDILMITRLGNKIYKVSKLLAAFLTTAIVFAVPFLLEVILNCIAFPLSATGDLSNLGFYNEQYIDNVHNYFISDLFVKAPYFYSIICTLYFSLISGILGAFTVAFSSIVRIKYKILLFLPVFLLLNATLYMKKILPGMISTEVNWYNYLLIFNDEDRNIAFFVVSLLFLILFSLGATIYSGKKECLK